LDGPVDNAHGFGQNRFCLRLFAACDGGAKLLKLGFQPVAIHLVDQSPLLALPVSFECGWMVGHQVSFENGHDNTCYNPLGLSKRWMKKSIRIGDGVAEFFGTHDGNIKYLESLLKVQVQIDGENNLTIDGNDHDVELVERLVQDYAQLRSEGVKFENGDLKSIIRIIAEDTSQSLRGVVSTAKTLQAGKRSVTPKTLNQKLYLEAIERHDMVFGIGPAGTGKTYLAVSMAVRSLVEKKVNRIVLTRPAVEAGERLGFLPGTLQEKIDPYLKPLYDALYEMLDVERVDRHLERGVIEIAPIAFMRGRTLNDSFVILDEAQNTTPEQMKMFLTRIGFNTKAVITGDITQIDLPLGKMSGLVEARNVISGVEGISFIHFNERDVVRHPLVQRIVRAYEAYSAQNTARQQSIQFGQTRETP
jgi:phosphate starvation-inducible PhoH-like protein